MSRFDKTEHLGHPASAQQIVHRETPPGRLAERFPCIATVIMWARDNDNKRLLDALDNIYSIAAGGALDFIEDALRPSMVAAEEKRTGARRKEIEAEVALLKDQIEDLEDERDERVADIEAEIEALRANLTALLKERASL